MRVLNDKLVSCESETTEYDSLEEFNEDKTKRRKERWNITKTPNWHSKSMEDVIKHNGKKLIVKWVRYGEIMIG